MKEVVVVMNRVVIISLHDGPIISNWFLVQYCHHHLLPPVPQSGLHHGVLQYPDPHVHPQQLLPHPGQVLPDVDQRGAVRHGTPLLLHLALDGLDIVRDLSEDSGSLSDAATDLFVLLPVLSVGLRELSEVGKC